LYLALNPRKKFAHFKKNWDTALQEEVKDLVKKKVRVDAQVDLARIYFPRSLSSVTITFTCQTLLSNRRRKSGPLRLARMEGVETLMTPRQRTVTPVEIWEIRKGHGLLSGISTQPPTKMFRRTWGLFSGGG